MSLTLNSVMHGRLLVLQFMKKIMHFGSRYNVQISVRCSVKKKSINRILNKKQFKTSVHYRYRFFCMFSAPNSQPTDVVCFIVPFLYFLG